MEFTEQGTSCSGCGLVVDSQLICHNYDDNVTFDSDKKLSSKRPYSETIGGISRYRHLSHLNEVTAQQRGGGGTINEVVFERFCECLNTKFKNFHISVGTCKMVLSDIGERQSYEFIPQILQRITKQQKPFSNLDQDQQIRAFFKAAKAAWGVAPESLKKGRTSLPNYKDFLKRCLLMIGDQLSASHLKGLKYHHKIAEMNKIWEYFGVHCQWPNYKAGIIPEF